MYLTLSYTESWVRIVEQTSADHSRNRRVIGEEKSTNRENRNLKRTVENTPWEGFLR